MNPERIQLDRSKVPIEQWPFLSSNKLYYRQLHLLLHGDNLQTVHAIFVWHDDRWNYRLTRLFIIKRVQFSNLNCWHYPPKINN